MCIHFKTLKSLSNREKTSTKFFTTKAENSPHSIAHSYNVSPSTSSFAPTQPIPFLASLFLFLSLYYFLSYSPSQCGNIPYNTHTTSSSSPARCLGTEYIYIHEDTHAGTQWILYSFTYIYIYSERTEGKSEEKRSTTSSEEST